MTVRTPMPLALAAALALAACTQPARPPQPVGAAASAAPADRLVAAIEAEGCVLDGSNTGAVLLRANLTRAELAPLMTGLAQAGRVEASGESSIRLLSDNCI